MSKKGIALFLAFLMLFSIFTPQMTTYAATTENIEEEWVEKNKQMEQEMADRIKSIGESFINDPAAIAEALAFGSQFYRYSERNVTLIYSQKRDAQYVQSFPAWKKMGYSVKRGETGLKIWVAYCIMP